MFEEGRLDILGLIKTKLRGRERLVLGVLEELNLGEKKRKCERGSSSTNE